MQLDLINYGARFCLTIADIETKAAMQRQHVYRDRPVVVTDVSPLGHADGTWLVYKTPDGWQLLYAAGEYTLHPVDDVSLYADEDDAVRAMERQIDRDLLSMAGLNRERVFEPEVLAHATQHEVARGEYALAVTLESISVAAPLALLMDLHNALENDDPLRGSIKAALRTAALETPTVAGVIVESAGTLAFNSSRAMKALHRVKMRRRALEAQAQLAKLQQGLLSLLGHDAEEQGLRNDASEALVGLVEIAPAMLALASIDPAIVQVLESTAKAIAGVVPVARLE